MVTGYNFIMALEKLSSCFVRNRSIFIIIYLHNIAYYKYFLKHCFVQHNCLFFCFVSLIDTLQHMTNASLQLSVKNCPLANSKFKNSNRQGLLKQTCPGYPIYRKSLHFTFREKNITK